jgi:tripartite-type tricarboxylate transporter receptor subunit TctC
MTAVVGGQIDMLFSTLLQSRGLIQGGKLRPLAVTTPARSSALPDLPTMIEAGVPRYEVVGWYGVLAPAGTPAPVIDRLNREMVAVMSTEEMKKKMQADGAEAKPTSAAEFAALIRTDMAKWGPVVKASGATLD